MISVILANYNGAKYLDEAIDSILGQSFQGFELLLVDDKSTDNSLEIFRSYEKRYPEHVRVIVSAENRGQANGFNLGFAHSKGELIAFMDSDDVWFPQKLAWLNDEYRRNKQYSIYQHSLYHLKGTRLTNERSKESLVCGDLLKWNKKQPHRFPWFVSTSGFAIPRRICEKILPMPIDFVVCADGYLTRCAMVYGDVFASLEVHGAYRLHEENNVVTNSRFDHANYINNLLKPKLNEFYAKNGVDLILK